jgi:hypothetical protein
VILSMYGKAQLSAQTRDWIERWLGLITDNKSALVALLDKPEMKRGIGRIHTRISTQGSRPERD